MIRLVLLLALICTAGVARADFALPLAGGERLEVKEWGQPGRGPLFIWLLNQYGERERVHAIADGLARRGARVWLVDLLDSLLLERSNDAIRNLDGKPVAALVGAAGKAGGGPVVLVAIDRMAVPLLRGLRTWQEGGGDSRMVAGAVLFFPNLYQGTPIAGEAPKLLNIAAATNLPLVIMQPALGAHRLRLPGLLTVLHRAGSPAYAWLVDGVRDYYLIQAERPASESLQALAGPVPAPVERAIRATPEKLLAAARVLAATPRPNKPVVGKWQPDQPAPPAYGLVKRDGRAAPDYVLTDERGQRHTLADVGGRVTLVNFWATWCPPCVHEIPSMNRLAAARAGGGFAIVSINFKEDAPHVQGFMDKARVDFPVLLDEDGAVAARWGVYAFPSSFLLDRAGRIRYSVNTAIDWDSDQVKTVIDRLRLEPAH